MVVMVIFPSICEICAAKYSSAVTLHFAHWHSILCCFYTIQEI